MNVLDAWRQLLPPGRNRRRAWVGKAAGKGKAHIEVRGARGDAHGTLARELATAFERIDAVDWVDLMGATGNLIVSFDEGELDLDDIVSVVEDVEVAAGVDDQRFADHDHPADREPLVEELIAVGADVAALGLAVTGRIAKLARLPVEVASIVPVVQSQPRLVRFLEERLTAQVAHITLATVNAGAQALAQGPLGLVVDGTLHATLAGERFVQRNHWLSADPLLHSTAPSASPSPPPRPGDRPKPLQAGPVERYADRAGVASVGGFAVALAATRSWQRAAGALFAGMPKAATFGREAFAAHVGRCLPRRDALVLDRGVLRRLDRIDCVVVDRSVLLTEDTDLADVIPLRDADDGARTLDAIDPAAETIVREARAAGHMVVVAGVERDTAARIGADLQVDGDDQLLASIRMLQDDGCGVLLVTAKGDDALAAADCGVALMRESRPIPYAADVLVRDLDGARFLVAASGVAYEASRQSVALALAGSSVGGLLVMTSPLGRANLRALNAVNGVALAALVNGTRAAVALDRRPAPVVRDTTPWHALESSEVLSTLGTTSEGLSPEEAEERQPLADSRFTIPPLLTAIGTELVNPFTPVLAAAAGLSAVAGSVIDSVLISSVAAANAVFGGVQRHRVESAVRALEVEHDRPVRVVRDGDTQSISAHDLVDGDVILLEAGDVVPADSRILDARNLEADESSLTGESLPVSKQANPVEAAHIADRTSVLYAGTTVAAGSARAVVVAIGDETEMGGAAIGDAHDAGGVERRLRDLTRLSLPVTIGAGGLLAGANILRGVPMTRSMQFGTSLAVAAVPEGLPMLATAAQLSAARRLAARGALVRNARSVEALGRVDVLCTDKTGTLTQGRITVQRVSDGRTDAALDALGDQHRMILAAGVRASPRQRPGRVLPHPTDRAVVDGANEAGVAADTGAEGWRRDASLPFEPTRGYHAALGATDGISLLSVKGAPEVILPRCTTWRREGSDRELDDEARVELAQASEALALRGLRVLAVAERPASDNRDLNDDRVARLTLLGFLALADPVRSAAAIAVEHMQDAGVSVVMVTGDHPSTAEGIADELGILNGHRVVTGTQLDHMDDAELGRVIDDVSVFARVTPAHKVRIVGAYQALGRTVAMTGDGANDAPAIRLADVGVALGERATPAARQTADVVVPDGRLETLIDAVVEGRAMWVSVRDALAILLGGNLGEVTFTLLGGLVSGGSPLSARQLLLVNLITDGLPALAIAVRPPAGRSPERLLTEGPDASLGRPLELAILHRAVVTAAAGTGAWLLAGGMFPRQRSTVALAGLIGAQLVQTALSGGRDGKVLLTAGGSAAALAVIIETPGISQLFGCTPIGPFGWAIGAGSAFAATAAGALLPGVVERIAQFVPLLSRGSDRSPADGTTPALRTA